MKKKPDPPADDAELRHRAEERLGEQRKSQKAEAGDPGTVEDTARLVHELQVHQIELEMQNEELQQAHAQVETLLDRYTDLYDLAPAGYLTFDREGAIRQVNLTGARLLGVERSRLVNRRFGLFVAEGGQRAFSDFLEKVFATQAKECCEVTLLHESSQPVVVQIQGTRSADGQECRAVVVDLTERKRAEEELRWKTAFLEAQVDSSLDGILVVDKQGKQILQNQRLNELWKIPPHFAGGKDDAAQVQFAASRAKNPKEFAGKVAHLYSHPDEVSRDEIDLIDGTVLDCYSSPVRDKTGKYYGRIWTFRDITQRRTLEAQFRQAQKLEGIGQLAAGVAHDFNNILAVIQLQASLLKAGEDLSSQQLESANEIEKATERAANLTRQLLLFSRRQTMQPRDLDLNQSINDMTKMLRRTLGEAIQVQFKFAMQPLLMHADAGMLDQVLMNLAVNAHDAMSKGGQLVIETSAVEFDESVRAQSPLARPGSFVCLSVGDTGCGIPPENLLRIFEPFFTTKDTGKGTGLGLATVFGIVQQHQGWINVYSEVGRGTIFRIYLPRLAAKSGRESGQPKLTVVRGGKETILLVEDEAALRASMHKALLQLGYHVLESVSGVEALKVWEQHRNRIDLLVTDMVMPGGVTGKDLAERFLKENPKLNVIYTSGYSVELAGRDFPLEEGVNFLAKPFGADKLAQTVREKLDAITEHTRKKTVP